MAPYYQRLFQAFADLEGNTNSNVTQPSSAYATSPDNFRLVATDLIGSGTACTPTVTTAFSTQHSTRIPRHLPLLNSSDWTNQLLQHMELHRDDVDD